MFGNRRTRSSVSRDRDPDRATTPELNSPLNRLSVAADRLASSLSTYSDAAYQASKSSPDAELIEARRKVAAARTLVQKGRLGFALGRCIPEHVKYWPSWSKRDDFDKWVGFNATNIRARRKEAIDSGKKVIVATIEFRFNNSEYRVDLEDRGMSICPGDPVGTGEVRLWWNGELVAEFSLLMDLMQEHCEWKFADVRALKAGSWMKDVIDISTQIEAHRYKQVHDTIDQMTIEAAKNIDI